MGHRYQRWTIAVGTVNFGFFFVYIGVLFATLVQFVDANGISIWGYSPQGMSGMLMAVTVVSAAVFMLAGGKLSDVYGSRTPILFVFLGVGFAGFALLSVTGSLLVLVVACLCIGAGQGGTSGPLLAGSILLGGRYTQTGSLDPGNTHPADD